MDKPLDKIGKLKELEIQREQLRKVLAVHHAELEGIKEFLNYDPVARYRGHVGKRTLSLMALLEDSWPETVTVKEAEMLGMGKLPSSAVIKAGRVPWEYVMDELADHFHMTEQELINHIKHIQGQKKHLDELSSSIRADEETLSELDRDIDKVKQQLEVETAREREHAMWKDIREIQIEFDKEHSTEQIKALCRSAGISQSGGKKDMILRLLEERPELIIG